MTYLLDTNVVSMARKGEGPVSAWMLRQHRSELHLSVITLGEIARGIEMKRRSDAAAAYHLANWLDGLRNSYRSRIIDVGEVVAVAWGRLSSIRTRGDADGLIAATALVHDLTVVTRNIRHFADAGVRVLDPWTLY